MITLTSAVGYLPGLGSCRKAVRARREETDLDLQMYMQMYSTYPSTKAIFGINSVEPLDQLSTS